MPSDALILTLDQGTTSSRAMVFDSGGAVVAVAQEEFAQHFPKPGWVEHDPEDIWQTTLDTARRAMTAGEAETGGKVVSIGIANQRETVIVWNRETGKPVSRAIVWQDRRTASMCEALKAGGHEDMVNERSGLTIDPYFSGTKLRWILENVPDAASLADAGKLAFGTVDSFLMYRLSGGQAHVTDETNASRTLLYNIREGRWDEDLLRLLKVPRSVLPEVKTSTAAFCDAVPEWFGRALPVTGVAGDQQSAAFGQACFHPGMVKSTYGTGCFLLANCGNECLTSTNRLLSTIACRTGAAPQFAVEGSIFIAGAVSQWLRDSLQIIKSASETELLAQQAGGNDGVYFVPAFTGLGAPHWDADARGAMYGLTRGTDKADIARAALESVAYQTLDLLTALNADGFDTGRIRVDGGMVANSWFLQFLADVTATTIDRPDMIESTARGAAFLSGLQSGVFDSIETLEKLWQSETVFRPSMEEAERKVLVTGWEKAVKTTLYRAQLDRE
ncbi:glycerol kinase GlpK [Henriciella marina]|uniref:Glycerol kinase GlpK n=1 Tax=Henriciella marina TaxID=453851 RepID=A0ABT4M040_9PROT|nr:glycerol kinase GlpK [Henriciella marina]MCZ4299163.1 glycerol kinase GlpK [Henriciella marina]